MAHLPLPISLTNVRLFSTVLDIQLFFFRAKAYFGKFCNDHEMNKDFSSARYHKSNGQVERAIAFVKNIIRRCIGNSSVDLALLQYRNMPLGKDVESPAAILMNRPLRTLLPCTDQSLITDNDLNKDFISC